MARCSTCLSPALPCPIEQHRSATADEWFALGADDHAFPLRDSPVELLRRLLVGGPARLALPVDAGCLETRAWFHLWVHPDGESLTLDAPDGGFALTTAALARAYADVRGGCVRFFDVDARPTLVLRPEGARAAETMAAVVARFARAFTPVAPVRPTLHAERPGGWIEAALRIDHLRADWCALRRPADLAAILAHYDLDCGAALRLLGEHWARPVLDDLLADALEGALGAGESVDVFVGEGLATGHFRLTSRTAEGGCHRLRGAQSTLCIADHAVGTWVAVRPAAPLPVALMLVDARGALVATIASAGAVFIETVAHGLLRAEAA
ncbi:hypothetical protein L6V77_11400 [Myxococcota bacterium]|nr:hypothetical protein [Myxococcota bacterium]